MVKLKTYIVKGNPLRKERNEVVAASFKEEGSYTQFLDEDGDVVAAWPTDRIFGIEVKND